MVAPVSQHLSVRAGERELVDYLVEHAQVYRRQAVVNYYVTFKSKRFVILAGPHDVDKMRLARSLAEALVGDSTFQWSCFQAHPWWATQTGRPGQFAIAHARFNALKLNDLIQVALDSEAEGLPCFVGIERMSRAEVLCYFHDLPRGLLWRADASTVRVHLPDNLFVTGTLDGDEDDNVGLSYDVSRYTTVVHIGHEDLKAPERPLNSARPKADWQREFIRSRIRRADQARTKLARILPDGLEPLAALDELRHHLGSVDLPPFVLEGALVYLANAFDDRGQGLFVESVTENLAIAQDYALWQNVLPCVSAQTDAETGVWDDARAYLAPRFPRARVRMERVLANSGHSRNTAQATDFVPSKAEPGWAPDRVSGRSIKPLLSQSVAE